MLFTSASELRFYFPTHAIDTLDPFKGVIDNSEHDFLQEKLGTPLYNRLCQWYAEKSSGGNDISAVEPDDKNDYYTRLLLLCQRSVAYDAFSRAIEFGIVSPNNGGINVPTSDDYGKVDLAAIEKFRQRCITEAHAAINRLLQTLEDWCQELSENQENPSTPGTTAELQEIVTLWKQSRYFYLAAGMLIPSARVLQEYLNIYDSREKFIQMLPDLRFLQEEILAPAIGEDLCAYLVKCSVHGDSINEEDKPIVAQVLRKARKYLAAALENRTLVLKTDKLRRQQAHDEAVRLLASLQQYIADHQDIFPETAIKTSPLYTPPPSEASHTPGSDGSSVCCDTIAAQDEYNNTRRNSALFATPFLN